MGKITTHLWFDREAKQAAEFYVEVFGDAKINSVRTIKDTPSGDCDIVSFTILGFDFMAISAGPLFKFTPAISFHVKCKTPAEVEAIWAKLSPGGQVMMEMGEYPWSKKYGWVADKYGVNWQIICVGEMSLPQRITPVLMYTEEMAGRAEEAMNFYAQVFGGSVMMANKYPKGMEPNLETDLMYGEFKIFGLEFGAMDGRQQHHFKFSEAISLIVNCEDQAEIDKYWTALSAVPESEQCGWLKDKYGVSWQIVPNRMGEMMASGTPEQLARVTQAFLPMKKFVIADLEAAYAGDK